MRKKTFYTFIQSSNNFRESSRMLALKSYHYVKIMNTNNSLDFHYKILYTQHFLLSSDYLHYRRSYTNILARPLNANLGIIQMVTENLPL